MAQDSKIYKQFPTQRLDEKPVIVMHRHWIVLAKFWLEALAIAIVPPIILAALYGFEVLEYDPQGAIFISIVLGVSLYYLFIIQHLLHHWVDYYLDIWAISDQRIVSIELGGLFNRVISELPIEKVQDVTSEIRGVLSTVLNYGNVYIQTAGEKERFVFEEVPYPQKIQQAVLRVQEQYLAKEKKAGEKQLAQAIAESKAASPVAPAAPAAPITAPQPPAPTQPAS